MPERPTHLARSSWFVLLIAVALVLASSAQLALRLRLPTDGWLVHAGPFGTPDGRRLIYDMNLVGADSPLRVGDRVFAVEGYPLDPVLFSMGLGADVARARWDVNLALRYSLLRWQSSVMAPDTLRVEVTPVYWTINAWLRYMVLDVSRATSTLATLILLLVASVVFARRHDHPAARALLVLCAALFAQWISGSLPDGISVTLAPPLHFLTLFFTYSIFIAVVAPTLLIFTLVFPQPRAWVQRQPARLLIPYLVAWLIWWLMLSVRRAELGWLGTLGFLLAAIAVLVHALSTVRDPVGRAQLRWAGMGFLTGLTFVMLTFLPIFGLVGGIWEPILRTGASVGMVVVGVSLAIAVLRYRLFDIDLLIRRTLLYSLVTTLLVAVFLGSVVLLQQIFRTATGQTSQFAVALSTLAIAALFNPLRLRIQAALDRSFYRQAYDADQIVAAFARMAQNEADLALITDELMQIIRSTIQPTAAGLWLAEGHKPQGDAARTTEAVR